MATVGGFAAEVLEAGFWILGKRAGGLPGRRVGALKAAKGDEGDFGLVSFEFRDSPDNALSRPDVADELWRADEFWREDFSPFLRKSLDRGMMLF